MEPAAERPQILIVDDEEDVVKPIAFRLDIQGFDVLMEPDGDLGFQTAVAELPDVILLDIMMPGIDGVTLCQILKQRADTSHIPIIMLTAKTTMGDVEKAFAAKADDYVSKPFEWRELLGKINRCLANRPYPDAVGASQSPEGA